MISDEETNSFETEENRNTFKLNHPEESIEEPSPEF